MMKTKAIEKTQAMEKTKAMEKKKAMKKTEAYQYSGSSVMSMISIIENRVSSSDRIKKPLPEMLV